MISMYSNLNRAFNLYPSNTPRNTDYFDTYILSSMCKPYTTNNF